MSYLDKINDPADLRRLTLEELPAVSEELREFILEKISRIGGHLGAALGVVELTVALHYAFESPTDRIIWDVGHQAHGHKILTGRRDQFHTLKQEGGLSGFLKRTESIHDIFGAGHASTSLSAALGVREGLRLKDGKGKVVALIGDGGMTGGMAFEALNNAGGLKRDLIVVLNDNGMSISPNVGGLSQWFSRKLVGEPMTKWRRRVRSFLETFNSLGNDAIRVFEHMMDATKAVMLSPGVMFEGLGFEYVGPVDGHDVCALVETFRNARQLDKPVLIHALTSKGKGCPGVEEDEERKHAVTPFDLRSGECLNKPKKDGAPSYTSVFGKTLCEIARRDPRVVAITAAMTQGTGLVQFSKEFPGRFYDVGIAEEHAVTFSGGMAVEGFRPVVAVYSSFIQRAYDQISHDICLQNLPVVFCMDRSGLVGADGPTHHGVFDLSFLRSIPGMCLMAPKDEDELRHLLLTAVSSGKAVGIRYPRGCGVGAAMDGPPQKLPWGKAEVLQEDGRDLLLIAAGPHAYTAMDAADKLASEGVRCTVINARFIKPLDEAVLTAHIRKARHVITIEENALPGGFGAAIVEMCEQHDIQPHIRRIGIPDRFISHGNVKNLLEQCDLSVDGIVRTYNSMVQKKRLSLATTA